MELCGMWVAFASVVLMFETRDHSIRGFPRRGATGFFMPAKPRGTISLGGGETGMYCGTQKWGVPQA